MRTIKKHYWTTLALMALLLVVRVEETILLTVYLTPFFLRSFVVDVARFDVERLTEGLVDYLRVGLLPLVPLISIVVSRRFSRARLILFTASCATVLFQLVFNEMRAGEAWVAVVLRAQLMIGTFVIFVMLTLVWRQGKRKPDHDAPDSH